MPLELSPARERVMLFTLMALQFVMIVDYDYDAAVVAIDGGL